MYASTQTPPAAAPTLHECHSTNLPRHSKAVIWKNTMRFTFTRTQAALACALALGAFSANVGAQQDVYEHTIITSSNGQPVMSGFG